MSLPNDDDDDGRTPWRDPFGHGAISSAKMVTEASSNDDGDDRTADETSVNSMSYRSGMTSVATNPIPRSQQTRSGAQESPLSAVTMNNDDTSFQSATTFNTQDAAAIQLQRGRNRRRLQGLGIATGASFVLFMYLLFPTVALVSMILFGSMASTLLYQLTGVARWEFQRSIMEGRGIGDYLPESVYEQLTSTSVHDYLSDPDGLLATLEHLPYLLLYMLPGLSPEQLGEYIGRLTPLHQGLLRNNQGLMGFAVNMYNHRIEDETERNRESTLTRFIMGDERLREWRERSHQTARQHHPPNMAPRRLELPPTIPEGPDDHSPTSAPPEDDESSLPVPPSPGIPATVDAVVDRAGVPTAPAPPATDGSSSSTPPSNPSSTIWISEESVLLDAVATAVSNIASDTTNMAQTIAVDTFRDTVAFPMYRLSLGVTAIGLGLGILGLSNGTYDLRESIGRLVSSTIGGLLGRGGGGRSNLPSGGWLVGSTIASGTTALVLGLGFFSSSTGNENENENENDASKTTGKDAPQPGDPPTKSKTGE